MKKNAIPAPRSWPVLALLPPFVAVALQLALWSVISPYVWFLFFPAVFISSWIGGLRPGLIATAVSAGLVWFFFLDPAHAVVDAAPEAPFPFVVFLVMGVVFSVFHERLRAANQRAAAALADEAEANHSLVVANDQVVELLNRTKELDRLKSEFFANVSHELRTPLTMILGPTRRLRGSPSLIEDDRSQLELIERNARHLLRLVNDLLEASALEAGQVRAQVTDCDLAALVRLVTGQFTGLADDRGLTFVVESDAPVPVRLDTDRVQRAVTNLVSNAFKFTPAGGRVRVTLLVDAGSAVVEVADSGPGIAPEDRDLIFERFRQIRGDASRRFGGTGLGLAIVRDIANLHDGTVAVVEAPEGGALFRLTLPLRTMPDGDLPTLSPIEDGAALVEELRSEAPTVRPADRPTALAAPGATSILVVEDNADVSRFVGESLSSTYAVTAAGDGPTGLAVAEALQPTLIVTDLMMPGMSGEEFIDRVRSHPELGQIPILVVSAKADEATRVRLLRAGANDFMIKPFSVEEFRARVDNLTKLRAEEQAHRRAQARAEAFLEAAPDATLVVGADGRIVLINRRAESTFGYSRDEMLGQPIEMLLPENMRGVHPRLREGFAKRPKARTMGSGLELSARRRDGSLLPVDVSLSPVETPDGTLIIAAVRDVSTQREAQEQLRHQALHDALTGLPSRLLLLDRLGQGIAGLSRHPGSLALLYVDLDRFKQVNDQRGHEVGDQVLIRTAERLAQAVRPQDTVARLGGDEFVIACGDLAGQVEALALAERVEEAVRQPIDIGESRIYLSASVGIALTSRRDATPEEILRQADAAMYRAKQNGRNRVEVFDEALGEFASRRFEAERALHEAIDADRLRLRYQPIIDLTTGTVTGVEALLRIDDPTRGLLTPDEFLDTAEETGLIVPIGRWVIGEACRQLAAWQVLGHHPKVSVNLSGRQVNDVDLRELVLGAVRESGADPNLLRLEVTETALMQATSNVIASFDELKIAGVGLAIDDFGTGWSSFDYLKRLPVDGIKIDRSFTRGLGIHEVDTAIVAALVALAGALGCGVTIEGVETSEQLRRAQTMGCDLGQGYLLGRPQTADEVEEMLGATTPAQRAR